MNSQHSMSENKIESTFELHVSFESIPSSSDTNRLIIQVKKTRFDEPPRFRGVTYLRTCAQRLDNATGFIAGKPLTLIMALSSAAIFVTRG